VSSPIVHPYITVTIDGVTIPVEGGSVALAVSAVPYATATVVLPLTSATALDNLDPRNDTRVLINGSSTGHWLVTPDGYGYGGYGHGPYGHKEITT
jgi:hypothetical protein